MAGKRRLPDALRGDIRKNNGDVDPRLNAKATFIRALAEYFAKDQAKMSVLLEMGNDHARHWARLRSRTPLQGYPTVEEAERILTEFLA